MFSKLMLLFIIVPLLELLLLIRAGSILGGWNTVMIVILTGIAGATFTKAQGLSVINKINHKFSIGQMPGDELVQGLLVLAGGLMLLTPGFITDIIGFTLLIPITRKIYSSLLFSYFKKKFAVTTPGTTANSCDNFQDNETNIIDVEAIETDPEDGKGR